MNIPWTLSVGVLLVAAAHADDDIDTFTVTAAPPHGEQEPLALPALTLSGAALEQHVAPTLGDTLARLPGVSASAFGAGASRPIVRGLGGERVRVLANGIGALDAGGLSDDHAVTLDPLAADRIEVLHGPAMLRYGGAALGGVVNVIDDRVPTTLVPRPRARFDYGYDEVSAGQSGGGTIDLAQGPLAFHLDGTARASADYGIPGAAALDPVPAARRGVLAHSDTAADGYGGGVSWIGDAGRIGVALRHDDADYGIPGDAPRRIALAQDRYDLAGAVDLPRGAFEQVAWRLGHNDYQHRETDQAGGPGSVFLNDEYEGRVEFAQRALAGFTGLVGVQVDSRDFAVLGAEQLTPPVASRSVGAFVLEARDVGATRVELGARYDGVDNQPGAVAATAFDVYSLGLDLRRRLGAGVVGSVAVTRGQRAPGIEELYNHGPHDATASYEIGDAGLRPETANALELGLARERGRFTWQLDVFARYVEDFVYTATRDADGDGRADHVDEHGHAVAPDAGMLLLQYRQRDAVFYGSEAALGYALLEDDAAGDLDLHLTGDYLRGRLASGDNLPRLTPPRAGAELDWSRAAWSARCEVQHAFTQRDSAPLETDTAGYTLLDLGVAYRVAMPHGHYVISATAHNLLDDEVRYHTSLLKAVAPQPGRSMHLGVRIEFE